MINFRMRRVMRNMQAFSMAQAAYDRQMPPEPEHPFKQDIIETKAEAMDWKEIFDELHAESDVAYMLLPALMIIESGEGGTGGNDGKAAANIRLFLDSARYEMAERIARERFENGEYEDASDCD